MMINMPDYFISIDNFFHIEADSERDAKEKFIEYLKTGIIDMTDYDLVLVVEEDD